MENTITYSTSVPDGSLPTSIYNYTIPMINGTFMVNPEKYTALKNDETFSSLIPDITAKMEGEQFGYGLAPVLIIGTGKSKYYTSAQKKALQKYREKNRAEYNKQQRELYDKAKEDADWKKKFNARSKENNKKYREKKKQEKLNDPSYIPKKRGRPRKDPAI
jgi:hypothetical protein